MQDFSVSPSSFVLRGHLVNLFSSKVKVDRQGRREEKGDTKKRGAAMVGEIP